ncbi:hypothetical protein M407DRAFT_26857 [Tulasnella calospora MUT 4182]|uniref:F-box domain-containing protein n=1 Tax=Tulasnella calospora MUT 4182 TaxID=1051891 RepID=A0A0C3QEV9_9AGAM|nr:hypothetical protein M407DRAFT_26857 [Tulasnella calospora MUT 4182]
MVCRYWMEVIDSTPELWSMISSRFHPELQARIIQNSRNQLLVVEHDEDVWHPFSGGEEKAAAFESLVEPSASRWQLLEYRWSGYSWSGVCILSLPLHNLKRLKFEGRSWMDQTLTLDAPKLSHVEVHRYFLNWRSLSGLQVLILESTNPTFNELMVILQASPGLWCLSLKRTLLGIGVGGPPDHYTSKICLPQLRTLHIYKALADYISLMLDWIEAPSLETLDITAQYLSYPEHCNRLCEAAGHHIGAFPLPRNQNRARVFIKVRPRRLMFGFKERWIAIWNLYSPQTKLAGIASAIKHLDNRICEEVTILDFSCQDHEEIGEYLRLVHCHFPRIDQIWIVNDKTCEIEVGTVLQVLSSPSQLGLTEAWLLPGLTKLKLNLSRSTDTDLGDRIAELVRRRREAEQTADISKLTITVASGAIDPKMVEILRESVMQFDLIVVGGAHES